MRVELIYSPGCNTYKKALDVLETVIAEERLPIAVEVIAMKENGKPVIRINGAELGEPSHDFEGDSCFLSSNSKLVGVGAPCFEQLRNVLAQKWNELTTTAV